MKCWFEWKHNKDEWFDFGFPFFCLLCDLDLVEMEGEVLGFLRVGGVSVEVKEDDVRIFLIKVKFKILKIC